MIVRLLVGSLVALFAFLLAVRVALLPVVVVGLGVLIWKLVVLT